jgi:hypothetical protein
VPWELRGMKRDPIEAYRPRHEDRWRDLIEEATSCV